LGDKEVIEAAEQAINGGHHKLTIHQPESDLHKGSKTMQKSNDIMAKEDSGPWSKKINDWIKQIKNQPKGKMNTAGSDKDEKSLSEERQVSLDRMTGEKLEKTHIGFKKLENKLAHEKNPPSDPAAVAAAIGRKKYGKEGMAEKAKAGMHKSNEDEIIGQTKSGKNVYKHFEHPAHKQFLPEDYYDASMLHSKLSGNHHVKARDKYNPTWEYDKKLRDFHSAEGAKHYKNFANGYQGMNAAGSVQTGALKKDTDWKVPGMVPPTHPNKMEKGDVVGIKDKKIISTDKKPAPKALVDAQINKEKELTTPKTKSAQPAYQAKAVTQKMPQPPKLQKDDLSLDPVGVSSIASAFGKSEEELEKAKRSDAAKMWGLSTKKWYKHDRIDKPVRLSGKAQNGMVGIYRYGASGKDPSEHTWVFPHELKTLGKSEEELEKKQGVPTGVPVSKWGKMVRAIKKTGKSNTSAIKITN
jgi:hypothetical protein